ncbi:hypothetical protein ACFTZB_06650 [Rhodococcus sp. NPDC057014]|uniref:sodium:solute symporter family transporter n=1 Tax=Rhodococcus sp. NPDC057014 TaxID=3346000 RepID=UPI0036387365
MLIASALDFMGEFGGSAFATILAVVAGLVWSASGAPPHTLWFNVKRQGATERERAAARVGVVAIVLGLLLGSGINVALIAGLALSIAASADLSALALSPCRKPINTVGAVTGIGIGLAPSVLLIALGPQTWLCRHRPLPADLHSVGIDHRRIHGLLDRDHPG